MGQHFPDYPYSDIVTGDSEMIEQLGTFGDILEGVNKEGLVSYAPKNADSADDARTHFIRHRTIATRLWLLGYLPQKPHENASPEEIYTDEFKKAVMRFQEDANLTVDGWVGDDQTWPALDALVSFESDTKEDKWYKEGKPLPALERAVQLRLFSLGLYPEKPNSDFTKLQEGALDAFRRVNYMFKLTGVSLPKGLHPETVRALFDQDNIVEKLAAAASPGNDATKKFVYYRLRTMNKKETDTMANRFIINVAKVELWLIGFNVNIDGKDDYPITRNDFPDKNHKLYDALYKYWTELWGKGTRESSKLARSITPEFFVSLQEINEKYMRVDESTVDEDYSKEVAEQLNSNDKIKYAWNSIQKRSVSLWDGVIRLWRWIKSGVKKIISFFKNLYRAFFRYATKAYKIVKTAIDSVVRTIKYFFQGGLTGSSADHAAILHDKDFDYTVFINNESDLAKVTTLNRRLTLQTAIFKLGTQILGLIFNTFKSVAAGILGWARVLGALVRSLRDLKPLYRDLKIAKERL